MSHRRTNPIHNKGGPVPAPRPDHWPRTTPELRERLGHELADLLDGALYEHPDLAKAFLPATAADQGAVNYVLGMRDASAERKG